MDPREAYRTTSEWWGWHVSPAAVVVGRIDMNELEVPKIVSFGGGVNSTAMLIGMHERGLRPDAILFADTGGEKPATYRHVEIVNAWCKSIGFPEVTRVTYAKGNGCPTLEQECLDNETLPSKAFGFGGCSQKWKRYPMDKWVVEHFAEWIDICIKIVRLIGIHAGETRRGKIPDCDKFTYRYPLREWGWHQAECEAAHERAGIPLPVKSACFFCPAMRKPEILSLAKEHPDLFSRAVEIERNAIEAGNLQTVRGLGRHWTWESLARADAAQLRLFDDCQAPLCDMCIDY